MQTPLASFLESLLNTASGFVLSVVVASYAAPWLGVPLSTEQNFQLTAIMTVVSVLRSYAWRRAFNYGQNLSLRNIRLPALVKGARRRD